MAKAAERYIEGIGRRKTAVARVRITPASDTTYVVNERALAEHFQTEALQKIVTEAIAGSAEAAAQAFAVSAKVVGGGINAQAEAVRHGISRALVEFKAELRPDLKKKGFLKRDPRAKERRKFGLKKARKSAQWSKR